MQEYHNQKHLSNNHPLERLLFDLEGDGLLSQITKIWCGVVLDLSTNEIHSYELESTQQLREMIDHLRSSQTLVGHNIIAYDLPALWKIDGPWDKVPLILDTLVVSRTLWPERPWGHSLEKWGKHLGVHKQEFEDFSRYTPEMLEYCKQDVLVNKAVLEAEEKEYGNTLQGYSVYR